MTAWLLDTNILSELRRPKPEAKVVGFVSAQRLDRLFVSAVTLAEIRFGIALVGEVGRRAELGDWLTHPPLSLSGSAVTPSVGRASIDRLPQARETCAATR